MNSVSIIAPNLLVTTSPSLHPLVVPTYFQINEICDARVSISRNLSARIGIEQAFALFGSSASALVWLSPTPTMAISEMPTDAYRCLQKSHWGLLLPAVISVSI